MGKAFPDFIPTRSAVSKCNLLQCILAVVLDSSYAALDAQIRLEHPPKDLQQHLEAHLGHGRVVAALAQLVADKGVLRPRKLVEARDDAGRAHLGADEVAPGVGHVRVLDAKDHGGLALELVELVQRVDAVGGRIGRRVGGVVRAEGAAVDVGRKVCDTGRDARVQLGIMSEGDEPWDAERRTYGGADG